MFASVTPCWKTSLGTEILVSSPPVELRFSPQPAKKARPPLNLQLDGESSTLPLDMTSNLALRCDSCGQIASPEHVAQRLRRLEWVTRYRPVHIRTLLLGAFAPGKDSEFLYSPDVKFPREERSASESGPYKSRGEAGGDAVFLLRAAGISTAGKAAEVVQAEFQAAGLFLAHVLECPVENGSGSTAAATKLLRERLPSLASRIRRSLKPKRVILVTEALESVVQDILALDLGCPVILNDGKPFAINESASEKDFLEFRELVAGLASG